jgi:beta-propeller repeat-containing protein/ASPM-SPD-2-Hydin domain-containing protein/centrosomal CEP192-like protein
MKGMVAIVAALGLLLVSVIVARAPRSASRPFAAASGVSPAIVADRGGAKENAKLVQTYGKLPLAFEANYGQTNSRVKFLSRGQSYTLFLTSTEAVLALQNYSVAKQRSPKHEGITTDTSAANVTALRMNLVGACPNPRIDGTALLPGKSNYFIGNDPAKWRTNVPMYAKVSYKDIYPGVDLVYYGNQGELEYDFVVAPGADLTRVRLSIDGAKKLETDAHGNLILDLAGAKVQLLKPIVYQQMAGGRKEVASRYVLHGRRVAGFEVAAYDRNEPLIIDPVLSYSTYLGGSSGAFGNAIAVDSEGNAYVTGGTASTDFPTKNPAQSASGGNTDVFVTKLDPTGSNLVYSTYLGGTGADNGNGIAVDSSGNAYVTGLTQSLNFPTKNPIQAIPPGGSDAFVAKLDSTGSVLVYSTYLGGSGDDTGNGIAADVSGNAYVAGKTGSINFPTKNPLQSASVGGDDAFVAKLDPTGSGLVYSTYLGGSFFDEARGIAVDATGNAYVTGDTSSSDFPTKNPFQPTQNGSTNAFVTKLDPTGSTLVYSTYLGGVSFDQGNGITVDSGGNAYVTGAAQSANFPTKNPLQAALKGSTNAFVTKFDPTGSVLVFSTYLGGSGNEGDLGEGIAVDSTGNIYVSGLTSSSDFPLSNPIQSSFVAQSCDFYGYGPYTCGNTAFVTEFNAAGSALVFSTYMGAVGGNFEDGRGIAVDAAGNVYVVGFSPSTNLLVTPGAFQLVGNTNGDAFVAKISPADAPGFSLSSFSLNFADQGVGGTGAALGIAVTNTGSATLSITSIVQSGDFAVAGNNTCGNSLAGGASCTINVTFTPTAAGTRTGTITFTDSAASSPQTISLTGNGVSGLSGTLSPTSLNFGNQTLGASGVSQTVNLKNTGSAPLIINSFSLAGDFSLVSTNCSSGLSLAISAGCAFNITFVPQAIGTRSGSLNIVDNSSQSPRSVPLSGVSVAPPSVTLSPTSLSFPAQAVGSTSPGQTVTLKASTGPGILTISSINASNNFNTSNNCGGSVAGGGSCSITVTFTPTAAGNLSGNLVIADNASDSPQMVPLSGLGADFSISSASSSQTIQAGRTASYTLNLVGTSGFNGAVQLTCTGAPPFAHCLASPNPVMLNGTTPASTTVTVSTVACSLLPTDPVPTRLPSVRLLGLLASWFALLLTLVVVWRAHREQAGLRLWGLVALACLLYFAALSVSCGGGGSTTSKCQNATPAGNYALTISGSAGGITHSTSLALTVQ